MDPQQKVRVERVVAVAADSSVDLIDCASGGRSGVTVAEDDRHGQEQRPSQAADRMPSEVRVLVDTGGNFWMRDLHQQCPSTTEEGQGVFAIDPADDRIFREESRTHRVI